MSEFFIHYPQVNYDITGNRPVRTNVAINLMVREKLKIQIAEDVVSYHPYYIPEGERPDITAYKKYGGEGFDYILRNIVPKMEKAGITKKEINTIMVTNTRKMLSVI